MRKYGFILSSVCILLSGALAAGFAAKAVVLPRTGETVSAGVLNVPSVLGQTAEEVLFYPWSLYGVQTLSPLPDFLYNTAEYSDEDVNVARDAFTQRFFAPFSLFGAQLDGSAAFDAAQCANTSYSQSLLLFLKDFPAQDGDGTPLLLSFALSEGSPSSISYLVRPQDPGTITGGQQAQALERVKADLLDLLTTPEVFEFMMMDGEIYYDIYDDAIIGYDSLFGELYLTDNAMAILLAKYHALAWVQCIDYASLALIAQSIHQTNIADPFAPESALDDVLAMLDANGLQIQIVSTSDQIIVLFTYGSPAMLGVYYDVQLERYSGIGLSYS